jgi:hypothetical protein
MKESVKQYLRELVDRARHTDQNAIGMIEEVRRNAEGGVKRAKESLNYILWYGQQTAGDDVDVGAEPFDERTRKALSLLKLPNLSPQEILHILCFIPHAGDGRALEAACVILSGGPPMSAPRVAELDSQVIPPYKPAFHFGLSESGSDKLLGDCTDPRIIAYICAGHCIGMTRKLQQVRGGAPFAMVSPEVGFELGSE